MVESDKLDRVRAVYLDNNGRTVVSADLRSAAPQSVQAKSIYAAHAALGLTVSDTLLQGCQPVIVEGTSDQLYLSALKTYLIGKGQIRPSREIVFVPTGGTRGIKAVAAVLASKEDELPFVILDSDEMGKKMAQNLRAELYSAQKDRVILIGDLLGSTDPVEVEDLLPKQLVAEAFSREYHGKDEEFSDSFDEARPIVPQMEAFATANGLTLQNGWKVDLARAVKRRTLSSPALLDRATDKTAAWTLLFKQVGGQNEAPPPRGTNASTLSRHTPEVTA